MTKQTCQFSECSRSFTVRQAEVNRGRGRFCSTVCGRLAKPHEGQSESALRSAARNIWKWRNNGAEPVCRICFKKADIHHLNGNPSDNVDSNHDRLCRSHHVALENSLFPKRKRLIALTVESVSSRPGFDARTSTNNTNGGERFRLEHCGQQELSERRLTTRA